MNAKAQPATEAIGFCDEAAWMAWLKKNHAASPGIWMRIAKKDSGEKSVSYAEALEVALCYGWIDGQKRSESESTWLQRFTPRGKQSIWSKINREKALTLIEAKRMHPAGLAEVERAKKDGRWERAYDSWSTAEPPEDLLRALGANARAKAFFAKLDSKNRYAILFRIHGAKRPETREKRIRQFVEMLDKGKTIYP